MYPGVTMKSSETFNLCLCLTVALILLCATVAPIAQAETLYVETYQGEPGFPTNPEVDVLGLGGMGTGSNGGTAIAPPLPVLTEDRVSAGLSSTGAVAPNETTSTFVFAQPLIASRVPFEVTGHFENLDISSGPGSLGFVAMLLYSSTTGYVVSASLFVYSDGTSLYPSINIAEAVPGEPGNVHTEFLPGIPVTSEAFDLTLVVDPTARTANTHLDVGGFRYELLPLALSPTALELQQPDTLTQTLGMDNRNGAGHTASVDFREFRLTTPLIRADIDVKPGDAHNVINLKSRDTTPVAIFGTEDFDATTIVPGTISLAGAPVATGPKGNFLCKRARVNRDRRPDLLCQVVTAQIDAPIGESVVALRAFTTDGAPVAGEDHVRRVH